MLIFASNAILLFLKVFVKQGGSLESRVYIVFCVDVVYHYHHLTCVSISANRFVWDLFVDGIVHIQF